MRSGPRNVRSAHSTGQAGPCPGGWEDTFSLPLGDSVNLIIDTFFIHHTLLIMIVSKEYYNSTIFLLKMDY